MRLNQEIIAKYLNNACSEGEQVLVEAWYKSFENNPDGISHLSEEEYADLYYRVRKNIAHKTNPTKLYAPPHWVWYAASMAAIFLIVFGLSFYWNSNSVNNLSKIKSDIPLSDWAKYENSSAKILKIALPDGSFVWLQPKTQLSYNQSDRVYRQVNLKGEAFFDVKRDEARPFLIYSGKMTTKVLGTSFNVKAFPETERFEVSVLTGKVSVTNDSEKEVFVTPKQQVILENKSDLLTINQLPKGKTFYWELASMTFDNTSMQKVVSNIEKNFNVNIHLNPALNDCRLSGNFDKEHLPTILEIICKSIDAEYEINENEIYLKGVGCE